jgi:hypothetical protein
MSPELDVIEQLAGGDLPLPIICGLFDEDDRAKRALANYISKGVVLFISDREGVLPRWKCEEILRQAVHLDRHTEVRVSLTDKGAKVLETGDWSKT